MWFVLSDADPAMHQVITVMVGSARLHTDKTTALVSGDHPFIRHDSNVDYGTAKAVPVSKLLAALKQDRLHLQPDMPAALLRRVRAGLLASPRTIHAVKDLARSRFSA